MPLVPKYERVNCQRCDMPCAWIAEPTWTDAEYHYDVTNVICNKCVDDEHTLLRFLGFLHALYPDNVGNDLLISQRFRESENVLAFLNEMNIILHDGNSIST